MRHFQIIASAVDVIPLAHALQRQPDLWNQNPLRTEYPDSPHAEADDIWLWFNEFENPEEVIDDREVIPYPAWYALPQARGLVFDLMHRVQGIRLGRCVITRLAPGKKIAAHADQGAPASYFERYQVILQNLPGSTFRIADETVVFSSGDVWHINNQLEHEVVNGSADDRIVMIVDIRC